jgi:hypothetical protein
MRRSFAIMIALPSLVGCAAAPASYVRADGGSADPAHLEAMLTVCKGEGAITVGDDVPAKSSVPWAAGQASRTNKEATVVKACMARNGYLTR